MGFKGDKVDGDSDRFHERDDQRNGLLKILQSGKRKGMRE